VQFGRKLAPIVLMIGLGLAFAGHNLAVLLVGIGLFAASTVFAFVTPPVEFDASRRALAWLDQSGAARGLSHQHAKDALFWAAMTYVVAALASLGQLLYYVMHFLRARPPLSPLDDILMDLRYPHAVTKVIEAIHRAAA
jgi:Zn-dependent membrane protease YugP